MSFFGIAQFRVEPRSGESPPAFGCRKRDTESIGGFRHGKTAEEAQGNELGFARFDSGESFERFAESDDLLRSLRNRVPIRQVDTLPLAAALVRVLGTGVIDQDVPHRFRGNAEEVAAILEWLAARQPHPDFVKEGRRVERLPRFFTRHLHGRKAAQFVVDKRWQLPGGVRIAGFNGGQDASDVGHRASLAQPGHGVKLWQRVFPQIPNT